LGEVPRTVFVLLNGFATPGQGVGWLAGACQLAAGWVLAANLRKTNSLGFSWMSECQKHMRKPKEN